MRRGWWLAWLGLAGCTDYDLTAFEGVDVHFQDPAPKVDILMVIDNSGSMLGYQLLLGARFEDFLTYLEQAEVDYRVAVTTTTVDEYYPDPSCTEEELAQVPEPGGLHLDLVLTPETPNPSEAFADVVKVGACGSGYEKGLEAARLALSPEMLAGANAEFLRDDAYLSLVFVSDEQDFSREPVRNYLNDIYAVKGQRGRDYVNASALVISDALNCIVNTDVEVEGTRYVEVAEQTGGVVGNLCNTDFRETITDISLKASRLRDTYFLSEEPMASTITVSLDGEDLDCANGAYTYQRALDYEIEKPAIVFDRDQMPRPGQQIVIRYNLGDGATDGFCTTPPEDAE